ncbi:MAG: tRNA lysidine(34) synthetase TilS [Verrucomicrobia bacterium]|nr:MAG: tRNA lysidine(34) synthetase TilS [Verrucomicrobiota bacterium]
MNVHSMSNNRRVLTRPRAGGLLNRVKTPPKKELIFDPHIAAHFPPSRRYLIGVSGGRDSVALLHRLTELGYRHLIVCHLDHQLRGRASKADAQFVKRLAARLKVECELDRTDIAALARRTKHSIESAGRMARYQFFARVARRRRCRTIFLGHHANDLVETFLINLFRGSGPTGFVGIRQVARQTVDGLDLEIVRPLLSVWRTEIDAYVKSRRLEFRDDETNETFGALRNRMRRRIIPYIEKQFGRKVRASIWRAAAIAADEAEWLTGLLDSEKATARELGVKELRAQPRALQRRTIHRWLQSRDVTDLNFETIERVRALLDPDAREAKTNLPHDRHARRRAGKLFIE